jgi:hypothetical protein
MVLRHRIQTKKQAQELVEGESKKKCLLEGIEKYQMYL